jgi:hypothetical protein
VIFSRRRSRNRYFCGCDNAIGTLTISVTDRQYRPATPALLGAAVPAGHRKSTAQPGLA